jgi:hypothetical protein
MKWLLLSSLIPVQQTLHLFLGDFLEESATQTPIADRLWKGPNHTGQQRGETFLARHGDLHLQDRSHFKTSADNDLDSTARNIFDSCRPGIDDGAEVAEMSDKGPPFNAGRTRRCRF